MRHSWSKYDTGITCGLLGGTLGAAGWIEGLACGLLTGNAKAAAQPAGLLGDFVVVQLCALGVVVAGLFLWRFYLSGRRLSAVGVLTTLLGTSCVLGTMAIVWMQVRGVLALAVVGSAETGQPGDGIWIALSRRVPPELAYLAPLILLALIAIVWWPPTRKRVLGASGDAHIQRGTPDGERPWHATPLSSLFPFSRTPVDQPTSAASPSAFREPPC